MSLLELKNVSKIYGDLKALDNVNIHVDQGEWVAIMGPSGSGIRHGNDHTSQQRYADGCHRSDRQFSL